MTNQELYITKLNEIKEDLKLVRNGIKVAAGQISAPRSGGSAIGSGTFESMTTALKKAQGDAIQITEELKSDKKIDPTTQSLLINDLEGIVDTIRKMLKKTKLAGELVHLDIDSPQEPEYERVLEGLWQDWKKLETYLPQD